MTTLIQPCVDYDERRKIAMQYASSLPLDLFDEYNLKAWKYAEDLLQQYKLTGTSPHFSPLWLKFTCDYWYELALKNQ